MKKAALCFLLTALITLASCSETEDESLSSAAASAPDSSSLQEESSVTEEKADESSKAASSVITSSESSDYIAEPTESFDTPEEFLDSGFVKEKYKAWDTEGINYIPSHDDEVIWNGMEASTGYYDLYYSYKDKPFMISVDLASGRYDSVEQIYKEAYDRFSFTLSDDKEEILSHCKYDEENDLMIYDEKNEISIGYISKRNNIGMKIDIVIFDLDSTIDDIIDFSRHIEF